MTDKPGPGDDEQTQEAPRRVEGPGSQIGPYRLLQQLGEGGFGAVYEAAQEQPVRRRVALKVIKLGMDTHEVIARFEAERQALAMMDHPHIARVLDAGATSMGRPYFVMGLVKGEPITGYCDRNGLSIPDRLRLFDQVCAAVQHAHTKGIIHRDIKPSNVLVSTQDDRPFAKVIDFGIAKATGSRLTDKTLFTAHHQMIGTPLYMSPEQADGSADIDTRTDIYSLGVVLYELLTGSTPVPQAALQGGLSEFQRVLREVEPPRPSARLSQSGETLPELAARRRSESRKLTGTVRGELDWIVMKALEKDRTRRYETANGLAMDLRRYLAGEPVMAAPPSASYQLRKLVRRYRVGLGLAAGIGLLLAAFAATTTLQNVRIRSERDLAQRERDKAEQITRLLVSFFKVNDPAQGKGATITAREILDTGARQIPQALADQPDVKASLLGTIGEIYTKLGLFEPAQPLLEESLRLRRAQPEDKTALAESVSRLASLLLERGRLDEAEKLAREALDLQRRRLGPEHAEVSAALGQVGDTLLAQDRLDEAEQLHREAVALDRKLGITDQAPAVMRLESLAVLLEGRGRREEAETLHRETLATARRSLGSEHPDTGAIIFNLGNLLRQMNRPAEAEPLLREALALDRKLLGDEHPSVASDLNVLGLVLGNRGALDEAESMLREALSVKRKALGREHPNVPPALNNLALVLGEKGQHAEAVALAREAVELNRKVLGPEHSNQATHLLNLATLLKDAGETAEAEVLGRQALAMRQKAQGEDHPDMATGLAKVGEILLARGKPAEAEELLEKARAFPPEKVPVQSVPRALAGSALGACLTARGKYAEAEKLLLDAHEIFAERSAASAAARQARQRLVDLYTAWGKPEKAAALRKSASPPRVP